MVFTHNVFPDCGSTVRRRAGVDGREEVSISNAADADGVEGSTRTEEEVRDAWRSPSPPPSIDSGQSGMQIDHLDIYTVYHCYGFWTLSSFIFY